mgnify:CR=1 FL=1
MKKKNYNDEEFLKSLAEAAGINETEASPVETAEKSQIEDTVQEVTSEIPPCEGGLGRVYFEDLGIEAPLLRAIEEMGYEHPMPIQEQVIPVILGQEHRDVVGLAQTGTGKTAAFGIPILLGLFVAYSFILQGFSM